MIVIFQFILLVLHVSRTSAGKIIIYTVFEYFLSILHTFEKDDAKLMQSLSRELKTSEKTRESSIFEEFLGLTL